MNTWIDIEVCDNCDELFKVVRHEFPTSGTKEIEPVNCPHCGHRQYELATSGWWETYPLTEDEVRNMRANKKMK